MRDRRPPARTAGVALIAVLGVLVAAGPAAAAVQRSPRPPVGPVNPVVRPIPTSTPSLATLRSRIAVSVTVSAHRGGSQEEPENTLEAFQNALTENVGEIEADTWITSDGVGVIEHDAQLTAPRCTGPYLDQDIQTLTLADLQQMQCDGQPIPTEDQLLSLLSQSANTATVLRLESKTYTGESATEIRASAQQVGAGVVAAGLTRRAIMQDFAWGGIAGFHDASPSLRVSALISRPTTAAARQAKSLGAYDLSYDAHYETADLNAYLRGIGLVPTVWNVDPLPATPGPISAAQQKSVGEAAERAVSAGAQVVIVNNPALVMSVLSTPSHCALVWHDVPNRVLAPTARSAYTYTFATAAVLPTFEVASVQVRQWKYASERVKLLPEGLTNHAVNVTLKRNATHTVKVDMAELNGIGVTTAYRYKDVAVTVLGLYARSCT